MSFHRAYLFFLIIASRQKFINSFDCHKTDDGSRCQKWNKFHLTYSLSIDLPTNIHHRRDELLRDLQRAFDKWAEISKFKFSETTDMNNADIKISFLQDSHGDCKTLSIQKQKIEHGLHCTYDFDGLKTLAHSFPPEHMAHGKLSKLRGELHFNANEKWKPGM